ncbi:MAG: NUDIX domain-containing protein, partial [Nocardioidaceae bacterium]|nr:NUDIX domain-containing protein [Nocardioidaceae bacterium]
EPEAAAYRELAEETGVVLTEGTLRSWGRFTVFHQAHGTDDHVNVYLAQTDLRDADITVGEGRQIVFVDPARLPELPLSTAAAQILPDFLNSNFYQELLP